ncbi:iron-sulfur cluster assembly accessory protein [Candidatus Woesearchaeota archaeon]|nr:iron-sulfur cluster assembly accessory protein [Candidatus Woesearchaeota archaeon]
MITAETTIGEIMLKYPQLADTMAKYGMKMTGCGTPYQEQLKTAAASAMNEKDFGKMLSEINTAAAKIDSERPKERPGKFEVTDAAVEKVKEMMKKQGISGFNLRIEVKPGGCAGYSYDFSLDDEKKNDDIVLEKDGLRVVSDAASAEALKGAIIDYVETLNRSGFKVDNPNAHAVCSCGSSFG